ncbi:MAG: hypothetical protein GXP49_12305, partial [Deltaproteobacteria bacterium]|nr:hypothetical protein [Deltaproteobacteria bacterium]
MTGGGNRTGTLPVFIRRITRNPWGTGKPYGKRASLFWLLFIVCGLVGAMPFFVPDYLPLQDLAANLSYSVVIHFHNVPGNPYDRLYQVGGFFLPNGMALYLVSWLANFMPFLDAARLLLASTAFLLPLSLLALLRISNKSPWWSFLAFSLVLNYPTACGYFPFSMSIPVLIFALALSGSYFRHPTWAKGISLALLSWLVFWAHAQAFLYLGLLLIVPGLMFIHRPRAFLVRFIVFIPSLILALHWAGVQFAATVHDPGTLAMVQGHNLGAIWLSPFKLLSSLPDHTLQRFSGLGDELTFTVLLFGGVISAAFYFKSLIMEGGLDFEKIFPGLLFITSFVLFLSLPYTLRIHTGVNTRMAPIMFLTAAGLGGIPRSKIARRAVFAIIMFTGITFGIFASDKYAEFQAREVGNFVQLIKTLPKGSSLAYLDMDDGSSRIVESGKGVFWHAAAYHFFLNQGIAFSHFHRYFGRQVQYRPGKALKEPKPPLPYFLASPACSQYEFLLIKTPAPIKTRFLPGLEFMGDTKTFSLWKI